MSDVELAQAFEASVAPPPRARKAKAPKVNLYPLQLPLFLVGLAFGFAALVLQDWVVAVCITTLFTLVGLIWRADMLPILPACISFQWLSATAGYVYQLNTGRFPGGGYPTSLPMTLMLAMLGLTAMVVGLRIVLTVFKTTVFEKTLATSAAYDLRKVFMLTIVLFAVYYVEDILPKDIWFGGAQIIENILSLRFVPYFILLVAAFERGKGYGYVWGATAWVLLPGLLTGFSDFKELLLVVIVAALAQWRPWVRSRRQARENRRILVFGAIGILVIGMFGIVWSGGVKREWRDEIWQETVTASPLERMELFFDVVGRVLPKLDLATAGESMAGRMSSGTLYFSYVVDRVPRVVPHENGKLFSLAIANATQPRFLFPNKGNLGGDSWLVRKYAGVNAAGDEEGASIGLGYMAEFFIDFGVLGVLVLGIFWGACGGGAIILLAKASPSREIFLALMIGLFTGYFMGFDGNFIKIFSGMLQRTLVAGAVIAIAGPHLQKMMLIRRPTHRPSPTDGGLHYAWPGAAQSMSPPMIAPGPMGRDEA
ncbi:hypothetical protein QO010_000869 [Caulobacter ginsengisoli]|uniref:O-antigen polymerase n=1 Tax=Caulobacter ginsengisoli TaxID=400775 RepID=A0ABU0IM77_9CAUL|nr:hypothetical protein [Caulobacter ginsengisoli]MDQ0463121.1 hypothetical protein [Caulobacter ginsengisoli]